MGYRTMIEEFLIVDEKELLYGKYDDEAKASSAIKKLSKGHPGIKFFLYRSVYAFYTPTAEEVEAVKQGKQFWR